MKPEVGKWYWVESGGEAKKQKCVFCAKGDSWVFYYKGYRGYHFVRREFILGECKPWWRFW